MFNISKVGAAVVCAALAAGASAVGAFGHDRTLVITMTNDPDANQIKVYDAETRVLVQTLSTHGKGGAGGNARGIRQHDGRLVAVVNNGSGTVAIFKRDGDTLKFDAVVGTSSAPVSVDFGNDHLYVAGETTVDSFVLHEQSVRELDGTTTLALAGGGAPAAGSTAQVGVINERQLLVTLKADPDPGSVDVIALDRGRVANAPPSTVAAPDGTLTPFGFTTYADGTALIALAHSNQDGLFRDGGFLSVVAAGQSASCWMTRTDKYVFVDAPIAASIATGGSPADIDADAGILGVVDHGAGESHLSLFTYNRFGELAAAGAPIAIGVPDANGVVILSARTDDQD
jgi:hypothetical protein